MPVDVWTNVNTKPGTGELGLNAWPVNRTARKMLRELGETADPARMYILQLVSWALKTGKTETEDDVSETINAMMDWRPERITNFFVLQHDDEYEPSGWREAETPLGLALLILDEIERKMVVHFPWYRSFNW
ncbi:MAG: hypothetical protein LBQ00_01585 [Syntrophobacterales bacterium]|jgi:hypothetical protein|nr:hypothetical protein [Syntrophobacterales bacterium]